MHFELVVIGSGPAGQRAALQASKLGKRTVVIERMEALGGVSIHAGTIPSKTLREAVIYLTGFHQRTFYGHEYTVDEDITMDDLMHRADHVIHHQAEVSTRHLELNGIEVLHGNGSFIDPHTVVVTHEAGVETHVSGDFILVATGSQAARPPGVPFDGARVLTSDDLLLLDAIPESLAVIGGGIIGTEYAGIFAALGVPVSLIDRRPRLLPFVDGEVAETLAGHFIENGMQLYLEEDVADIDTSDPDALQLHLESGKTVRSAAVLYAIGRVGLIDDVNLEAAGIQPDERGRISVNTHCQTAVPHIYAAGDVIGAPALAATSMEQGRIAACHAFGVPEQTASVPLPYAIYTVPEVAMIGPTTAQLDQAGIEYVVGRAAYNEIARGRMLGDQTGFLKMLFHAPTGRLLGVHVVGSQASELLHIGQAVINFGGGIDYFIDTVFNYPTLGECYKAAALDAANDLRRAGTYASIDMFVPAPQVPGLEERESV